MKRAAVRFAKGFRVLADDARSQAASMVIASGGHEGGSDNRHKGADQWLYVVSGRGEARINGRTYRLKAGALLLIERGESHEIRNTGSRPMKTLNFYVPPAYTRAGNELPAGKSS
jgi:mannose-6-phosphate isomerase-like protein (cupin superfamily)